MEGQDGRGVGDGASVPAHMLDGLLLLLQAYRYAQDVGRETWDFALDRRSLRQAGLNDSDLRWLVCKGYVEHAHEVLKPEARSRTFLHLSTPVFSKRSAFVLTPAGSVIAAEAAGLGDHFHACTFESNLWLENIDGSCKLVSSDANSLEKNSRPKWDCCRHEIRVGGVLVKAFRVPSPNQETILAAFEEEGWPPRVDDPLPPRPDLDSKRRLHDTVKSLNRNQKARLIRFTGDGTGEGVCWAFVTNNRSRRHGSNGKAGG